MTQAKLTDLRDDPKVLEIGKQGLLPYGFEVVMVRDLAGKFSGRRTFIELLEAIVPDYYEEVGQQLQAWVPPPPKIEPRARPPAGVVRTEASSEEPGTEATAEATKHTETQRSVEGLGDEET